MITQEHLEQIMLQASRKRLAAFAAPLAQAMQRFGIERNVRRAAAFIAQIAHESGQLRFMEEIWGPTAAQKRYEPPSPLARRLGNREPGDGFRFKGRGPIQITGRDNYRRYGELLGIDLVADPQQAATPETGFAIAGLYWERNRLNDLADAGDFEQITRRINGGLNGLEDRQRFFERALRVLAPVFPAAAPVPPGDLEPAEALPRGAEAIRDSAPRSTPDANGSTRRRPKREEPTSHTFDARPDTADFRDQLYQPTLIEVPTHVPLGDYLDFEVPILDQGQEGACTGFGLATVANYLLLRRRVLPDRSPVSARMLYILARRYDEWPGEDYEGSSARGAMKGWHKHGVCKEASYPSLGAADRDGLTEARTAEARRCPLGAYFRVNHRDLVAMHSALAEVGVLYATCVVHDGWERVGEDGSIPLSDRVLGGHAFALVAFDDEGFWLQNSWGSDWGWHGFARISYDDWLRNGTDVWVARLGAPVMLRLAQSTAAAHSASAGESVAYSFADLRPHIVSIGNEGRLRPGGDYGSTADGLRHLFERDLPRVSASWARPRILLYAHGGLVSEHAAVQRLADYRPTLLENEVYPLALIWKTDYWTTIGNVLQDAVRRRRPEGALDAAKDFMLDRLDDGLEPLARILSGKAAWDEMKENAQATGARGGAARLLAGHLRAAIRQTPALEVHLVAHSAGSILLAPLIGLLAGQGVPIASCTLWAPACTVRLFEQHYRPAIDSGAIARFALYVLSDKAEQDDDCKRIYNKSLLYLVSHAFEEKARIPFFRDGEPLLGMERWLDARLRGLFEGGRHELVIAPNQADPDGTLASDARRHDAFDDDPATVKSTFRRILGTDAGRAGSAARAAAGAEAAASAAQRSATFDAAPLSFERSAGALRERRERIDERTAVPRGAA